MRRINKAPTPPTLAANAAAWTAELLAAHRSPEGAPDALWTRYATDETRAALKGETYGKCAYCESRIEPVAFEEIEHIIPKRKVPERTYEWNNLTLACRSCNGHKSQYHDPALPLIDPTSEEPSSSLAFKSVFLMWLDDRGHMTVDRLRLNGAALIGERARLAERILELMDQQRLAGGVGEKAIVAEALRQVVLEDAEYVTCARALIESGVLE